MNDVCLAAGYGAIGSVVIALICALTMHYLPLRSLAMVVYRHGTAVQGRQAGLKA